MPADAAAGPPPAGLRSADGSEPGPAAAGRAARRPDWHPRRSPGPAATCVAARRAVAPGGRAGARRGSPPPAPRLAPPGDGLPPAAWRGAGGRTPAGRRRRTAPPAARTGFRAVAPGLPKQAWLRLILWRGRLRRRRAPGWRKAKLPTNPRRGRGEAACGAAARRAGAGRSCLPTRVAAGPPPKRAVGP